MGGICGKNWKLCYKSINLGLGGAIILGPAWMSLGVTPSRSTASTTFTVLFSGFISVMTVATAGRYVLEEILFFIVVNL